MYYDRRGGSSARRGGRALGSNKVRDRRLFALTSFSAANRYETASGGGEAGVATGFGAALMVRWDRIATVYRAMLRRWGGGGYVLDVTAAGQISAGAADGGGVGRFINHTLVASDAGKWHFLAFVFDGSSLHLHRGRDRMGSVACVGYTPNALAMVLGANNIGTEPFTDGSIAGLLTWRGVPSIAQMAALADYVRVNGDMPTSMDGATVTHRESLKEQLRGQLVINEQTAPATLEDTITRAAIDGLARVGSPAVKEIDPRIDGRRTYGMQGAETTSRLQTAAGAGIRGSAEFVVGWYGRIDALTNSTAGVFVETFNGSGAGWFLAANSINNTNIVFRIWDGAATGTSSGSWTPVAADTGLPVMLIGQRVPTAVRLYLKRQNQPLLLIGETAVTNSGATLAAADHPMTVGARSSGAVPARNVTTFGIDGGDGPATLSELSDWADRVVDKLGRMTPLGGRTNGHSYDLTTDIEANGGPANGIPPTVLDRVGTSHLSRVGVEVQTLGGIRGVGPYSATDGWIGAPGAGIQGANTFHVVADVVLTRIPPSPEIIAHAQPTGSATGWMLQASAANGLRAAINGVAYSAAYSLSAGDLNRRVRVVLNKTSSVVQLFVDGVQAGVDVAAASFTANASTVSFGIGQQGGTAAFASGVVEIVQGGNTTLTPAEIATTCANLTAPPPIVMGKTLKRWRFEDDIAANAGKLPAQSVERVSGGDNLSRTGAPLQVAQRVENVYAWESTPVRYAVSGVSDANRFTTLVGEPGDASGFFAGVALTVETQVVASATRGLISRTNGSAGFDIRLTGTNSILTAGFADGAGAYSTNGASPVAAGDVGKVLFYMLVWDAAVGRVRAYAKRVEVGTGTVRTGYTVPPTAASHPWTIGGLSYAGYAASGVTIHSVIAGRGVPSLAVFQALSDDVVANNGRLTLVVPGTTMLIDTTLDITANGGAMPSQLLDRVGNNHFAREGTPSVAPQYARAMGW